MASVGIIGGAGYTGSELLRIALAHPELEVLAVTSRQDVGKEVSEVLPLPPGVCALRFVAPDDASLNECDLVFLATPNGVAMDLAPRFLDASIKVVDLSADFRFKDVALWQRWYGQAHRAPELNAEAVYGLPELFGDQIKDCRLVANPGCYPTAASLALAPLLSSGAIEKTVIVNAASGVSGAGKGAAENKLFGEVSESFKAYGLNGHRHQPEIAQILGGVTDGSVSVSFIPHLLPMFRGILASIYVTSTGPEDLNEVLADYYGNASFIKLCAAGTSPDTRSVRGSNFCSMSATKVQERQWVVISAIDNLVKGAAGQAVQNANLMFGLNETAGLDMLPFAP
ncbi:MAG: N-acetyl-gamma-glutamyl-phosphate reductase [Pseudomonadota bacterium]